MDGGPQIETTDGAGIDGAQPVPAVGEQDDHGFLLKVDP